MFKQLRPQSSAEESVSDEQWAEQHWTEALSRLGASERSIFAREDYRLADPYITALPKGSRLLDAGCGMGEWVLHYARQGYRATGIDLSRALIDRLSQARPEEVGQVGNLPGRVPNPPHFEFLVRDLRTTGFPDATFDAYVSWGVWEHFVEGPLAPAAEAHRILKPGGLVCAAVPYFSGYLQWRFRRVRPWEPPYADGKRFYQWRFTVEELHRLFEAAGFRVEWIRPIGKLQGLRMGIIASADISRYVGGAANRLLRRALVLFFYPLLSRYYIGHMLMGVGRKEAGRTSAGFFAEVE